MKINSISPCAKNIDRRNSFRGLGSDDTSTALISMPDYAKKLFMIRTRLAIPVHSGSRWLAVIGAADTLP